MQEATGQSGQLAYVDQGDIGSDPAEKVQVRDIRLEMVKLPKAKRGFVLVSWRWWSNAPLPGPAASVG